MANSPGAQLVYFGTYTGQKSQGIYVAEFETATGRLSDARLAAKTRNPTFLAIDPKRQLLYAVNEIGDFEGGKSGAVSAFRIDAKTGNLDFLNEQSSGGAGPCHLAVASNGTCVLVANYGSGSVAVLPLEADGRLRAPSASVQHHGGSINPQRQDGPHAHFITWSPDEQLILTCDLGLDQVLFYRLDPARFLLNPNEPPFFSIKPGSGPRHLAFHPAGRFAYVLNEISSTLTCCTYDSRRGLLNEVQTVSTLPGTYHGANTCAEVQIHPSGKYLYASNRGHDSIAVFKLDSKTGAASLIQNQSTQGKTPRHFSLGPAAGWLIAENQDSDNVVVFKVDGDNGTLAPTGQSLKIGAPVCAVFLPTH
ncbi:MAG TPA: lactonase family protein [Verrucomicrobiae bacterium]|nr:lactonase family protein [Verrucomicrobiae bacterium]